MGVTETQEERKEVGEGEVPASERGWEMALRSYKEQLFNTMEVKIRRHVKVIDTRNPYVDTEYLLKRQKNRKYERGYRDKGFVM